VGVERTLEEGRRPTSQLDNGLAEKPPNALVLVKAKRKKQLASIAVKKQSNRL